MVTGRLRAVILVPRKDSMRWQAACLAYCERERYRVVGLVVDNGRIRWAEIRGMFIADEADVLVLARREHLPPQRRPRIEVVNEHPTGARAGPRTRRARIVRRPESGAG